MFVCQFCKTKFVERKHYIADLKNDAFYGTKVLAVDCLYLEYYKRFSTFNYLNHLM